jgi:hypothetical protein
MPTTPTPDELRRAVADLVAHVALGDHRRNGPARPAADGATRGATNAAEGRLGKDFEDGRS